jgi:hypothetical protein
MTDTAAVQSDRAADPLLLEREARRHARESALGWFVWLIFALVITVIVARHPTVKAVSNGGRVAALHFLHGEPMYVPGRDGWIYPVQSAVVYLPFALLPRTLFEVVVRLVGIGLLARGTWRLAGLAGRRPGWGRDLFLFLTALILPVAAGSARNGQMNLPIAAMFLLAALDAHERRWNFAAFWLTLSLACKPISIVIVLLLGVLHRPLWWRLAVGLVILAVLPLLHPDWHYALAQYRAGLAKIIEAANPGDDLFCDLAGIIGQFNVAAPPALLTAVRALAAVATLALSWLALRRFDRRIATAAVYGLGTAYLMVFNPRTEGNTYVILAPAMALFAGWAIAQNHRSLIGWALIVGCLLLAFGHVFQPGGHDHVVRPTVALAFLLWLAWGITTLRGRRTLAIPKWPDQAPAVNAAGV